jgi:hypothetical protein
MVPFLILLAFELFRNWFAIVKMKQTPNHARGWALRILAVIFIAFFKFDLELSTVVIFGRELVLPVTTVVYCIGCGLAFWFPFDVGLNLMRGKVWNYLGKDAVLDRFNLPGDIEWIIKFVLMLVGIWLIL